MALEDLVNNEIIQLEKKLEQYITRKEILERKAFIYKTHDECRTEKWKEVFLYDYEYELTRRIKVQELFNGKIYK